MENKNSATGTHSLRWFMIQRFLLIMLFVFISEELIGVFYRGWMASFLTDVMHVNEVSFTAKEGSILLIILQQVLLAVVEVLPEQTASWIKHAIGSNMESGVQVAINSSVLDNISNNRETKHISLHCYYLPWHAGTYTIAVCH